MIVQSDRTVLLQMGLPLSEEARDALARFAELIKSPEHVHTYSITPLSLWNAAAAGVTPGEVDEALTRYSRFPVPPSLASEVADLMARWGRFQLHAREDGTSSSAVATPDCWRRWPSTRAFAVCWVNRRSPTAGRCRPPIAGC